MPTLERLRYFVTVAKTLNFTKAAEQCYIAQTAMSRQIAALEQELDVLLFERDNRAVRLTPAGEIMLETTERLLEEFQAALRKARRTELGESGSLQIGIGQYEMAFVGRLIREFLDIYPDISISVSQYRYKELVDKLKLGDVDIIFALPISAAYVKSEEVKVRNLFYSKAGLLTVKDRRYTQKELAETKIITLSEREGPCSVENFLIETRKYGIPHAEILMANSLDALFSMVEAGMGVACVPMFLKGQLPATLELQPQNFYPGGEFVAMTRRDDPNPVCKLFANGLQNSETLWGELERANQEA